MDSLFHSCEPMRSLSNNPVFEPRDGFNTETKQPVQVVFMHVVAGFGTQAIQVYYCPWCGLQLTNDTPTAAAQFKQSLDGYHEYRKRHVKSEQASGPLGFEEWRSLASDFDELDFLLRHAKPEHRDAMFRRKQMLRDRLALGVVVRSETAQETAEDFVAKMRQWRDATPDFDSDELEGMQPMT